MASLLNFLILTGFFFVLIVVGLLVYSKSQRAAFEKKEKENPKVDPYAYGAPSEGEGASSSEMR